MSIFQKKYAKDWLWVLTAITCVFGAVVFPGLSDYVNHNFWWKFWDILGIVCAIGTISGWIILSTKKPE